jgi:hypothetical protein
MFVPVSCTNCGKPFQVPEEALGKPTPCPWCQAVVTALPVSAPQAEAKPQAAEPKPEPLSLDDDEPPAPVAPVAPPRARARPVTVVAVVVVGLLILVLAMAATVAFRGYGRGHLSERGWSEFTAPDGSFTVLLPGDLTETDRAADPGNSLGPGKQYTVEQWYSKTSVWVFYHDLDPELVKKLPADRDRVFAASVLQAARERERARFNGEVVKEAEVRVNDAWGIELQMDTPGGTVIEWLLLVGTGPRPRLYGFGVQARDITPTSPAPRKLFSSFRVNK